jgi:hypothetical protein
VCMRQRSCINHIGEVSGKDISDYNDTTVQDVTPVESFEWAAKLPDHYFRMHSLKAIFWLLVACAFFTGCGGRTERMPVAGTNWLPQTSGGPIEIRKLPPASHLQADYVQWLKSDPVRKVRVYETLLWGSTNQLELKAITQKGDTPAGAVETTFVRFTYVSTNGVYWFTWSLRGRHPIPSFLKATASPRKLLVQPMIPIVQGRIPKLQIVGIENIELGRFLVAEQGDQTLRFVELTNAANRVP